MVVVAACGFSGIPGVPSGNNGAALTGGSGGGKGDPGGDPNGGKPGDPGTTGDCSGLKEKLADCQQAGLDCTGVMKSLDACTAAPACPDPCSPIELLYKKCVSMNANDPFCDEVMSAFSTCGGPSDPSSGKPPPTK
jgi:hypothetical protein